MRVITWNVAGRVGAQPEQAAALAAAAADIVALQEVTARTAPLWRSSLADAGLTCCVDALDELPPKPSKRRLAVMTAARMELRRLPVPPMPWPERVLHCAGDGVEVINVHSPIAPSPELAKIRTHEALAAHLTSISSAPRVLCGDLNTPRREHADGSLLTFAHDSRGRLRPERGERWDTAERALIRDLGWVDAFRTVNGYGTRDASWTFKDNRGGWRLDHVLVDGFDVLAAAYAHEWRKAGLSDHSPLVVELRRRQ
ncbi:MAG TPA: endonuclease/exonuclease/phosphatase family protein [Solirubrobacter sp.]